jgi:predicted nucleic acid-binding protein
VIVVADTSPIKYLVLMDAVDILPRMYQRIVIPPGVEMELTHARTPQRVREWMKQRPAWLEVIAAPQAEFSNAEFAQLDLGEREAISLATTIRADQIVIDEMRGRQVASALGLQVIGTLGILREASLRGLIDLPRTIKRLQETRFRIAKHILEDVLRND